MHRFALLFAALAPFSLSAASADWPNFLGANANRSEAKGVPLTWSASENVKWRTALPGEGWSSPVVQSGQVWMTASTEEGKSLRALCVDLESGRLLRDVEVFRNEVVPPKHRRNSYASPSPILEDGRLYVHFGAMGTACLETKDGTKIWERRDLPVDHQNAAGGSPTLWQDRLLIACDGMDAQYEVALDKATGKTLWRSERSAIAKLAARPEDLRKAYGTPVVLNVEGHPVSISTGAERLYGLDPQTGGELWFVNYPGFSNVPLPVSDGKLLFVCTGFGKPEIWAVRLGGAKGDATASHVVWKQIAGIPDQATPLLTGQRLYLVNSGGIASCLDTADGHIVWKQRIGSDFAASPLLADGRIYFFDTVGNATVIAPGDTFQLLAKNVLPEGCMASPAVSGKALIVRTKSALYRIEN